MYRNSFNLRKVIAIAICLAGSATMFAQETGVEIDGITWATRNVGAPGTFVDTPEDGGMFYQWNSNVGWSAEGIPSDGTSVWNPDWDGGDAETWELANDPCPAGWQVPSFDDFEKLVASDGEWITTPVNGIRYGSGENTVFIPAVAGFLYKGGSLETVNIQAIYWCSTSYSSNKAYDYYFYKEGGYEDINFENVLHAFGFCVRCVKDKSVGINSVSTDTGNVSVTGYFDILGRKLKEEPTTGIYIIRYDNGTTKKVMR